MCVILYAAMVLKLSVGLVFVFYIVSYNICLSGIVYKNISLKEKYINL